jgi:hypothetical protein
MRYSAFHPSDCMAVNARCGHVVVKRLRRQGSIYLKRGRRRNAKPGRLSPNGTIEADKPR